MARLPASDRLAWWGVACPWVGLELAQSLLELDRHRRDDQLVAVAEGVVATVARMRARDADRPQRIPDAFDLVDQREEYPMWLVPRNLVEVCSELLRRRGELDAGCVRVGAQVCRRDGTVLDRDHSRVDLPHDVAPGSTVELHMRVPVPTPGWPDDAYLKVDLVLEGSSWFEDLGQLPVVIPIPQRC